MIRLTKKIFDDLAILMMGFGLLIGIVFPFFIVLLGVPGSIAFRWWFFLVCILAGIIVGAVNIVLARTIVGRRLTTMAGKMQYIGSFLAEHPQEEIIASCSPEKCLIERDSDDELGECVDSYNRLVASLYQSFRKESMVKSFSRILSGRLELDDLAASVLPSLMQHVGAEAGAIFVEDNGELIPKACHRIPDAAALAKKDLVASSFSRGRRTVVEVPEGVTIEGALVDFRPAAIVLEPIRYLEVTIGMLVLAFAKPVQSESLEVLDLLSDSLAVAMKNSLTYDQLQRLAANDSLTGLFNRRFGMARLQEEFGRAVRNNAPLGVCIFDLDHFKSINDTYGHQVGDKVLVHFARILKSALREGDVSLRYGGEEFMAVLPGASLTDAYQIAERIRRMVEDAAFQYGPQTIRLTVSGGATSWPDFDASSPEALVRRADESLYSAKQTGRNRITVL